MRHEFNDKVLEINDSDVTFNSIYEKKYIPKQYVEDIKKANVLIIPNENVRDKGDVLFPETTYEFYNSIKRCDDIVADIAISDEDFQRLELHSATITVATVIVSEIVLPIFIGLVTNFLYDLVKKYRRNSDETSTEITIYSEETKTKKCKKIVYKGPVSGVKEALYSVANTLQSERD